MPTNRIADYVLDDFCPPLQNGEPSFWKKSASNNEIGKVLKEHREQIRERSKKYRQKHGDQIREYSKKNRKRLGEYNVKYHKTHVEQIGERKRKYRKENRERVREQERISRQKNIEKIRERDRESHKKHREHDRENKRKWSQKHREKVREQSRRRDARKLNAPGFHTAADIKFLRNISGGFCSGYNMDSHYVGKEKLALDHIKPLSKGGSNDISNLQMLCKSCNSTKGVN